MQVRAILQDELVDWKEIKKWEIFETELWEYLLRNYSNHREEVKEEEKHEEKKPIKKVVRKIARKK